MGQYYYIVNIDKRQYLHPHKFGDGLKLMAFGCSGDGTMAGLAVLLSNGNGNGGGDLDSDDPIVGSWAGDRIVVAGDYGEPGKFMEDLALSDDLLVSIAKRSFCEGYQYPAKVNLHHVAEHLFEDISGKVIATFAKETGCALSKLNTAK